LGQAAAEQLLDPQYMHEKSDTGRWLPPIIGDVSRRLAGLLTEARVLVHTFAVALHSFVLVQLESVIMGNMRKIGIAAAPA
jgi:hypothetical protein